MGFFNRIFKQKKLKDFRSIIEERIRILQKERFFVLAIAKNRNWISRFIENLDMKIELFFATHHMESMDRIKAYYSKGADAPDVMIIEIIPGQSLAYEVYDQLSIMPALKNTPLFLIADDASIPEKMQGIQRGAVDFISPYKKKDELKNKIINFLYLIHQVKAKSLLEFQVSLFKSIRSDSREILDHCFQKYDLSSKEKAVLRLVLQQDMEYKEIAQSLDLTESAVKKRIHVICQKCGVKSKKELIEIFVFN